MSTKIIICDDEQDILDITGTILETEGFIVIPVLISLNVETLVASELPDIILLDLWMPGLSGDQIVMQLKNNERFGHIPIVIMSASQEGRSIASTSGADDFLEKPYDYDELINIINKNLRKSSKVAS